MVKEENIKKLYKIFDNCNLSKEEQTYIFDVIKDIFEHDEFQRRMTSEFYHHNKITLGEHILKDTAVTYILCKKKNKELDIPLALHTAMMHDLYEVPWQNNIEVAGVNNFFNKHGFRHPIEASINSLTWFPEYFKDDEQAYLLIDGIIHHMYPFPVVSYKNYGSNTLELKNYDKLKHLTKKNKLMIEKSSNRKSIGCISITPSLSKEGRIMSTADTIASLNNFENISGMLSLVTGKNKNLKLQEKTYSYTKK